jgi:DNA-binding NarL/FixJ family response regulator
VDVPVRLLLVEDLPQLQGVVLDLLGTVGDFQLVKAVSTEAEANLWLDENKGNWDLAVIDLVLEQGTGLGVVARARQRHAGSKVVVFSDYASEGIRKHCIKLGADAAFQKSDDLHAFLAFCTAVAHPDAGSQA